MRKLSAFKSLSIISSVLLISGATAVFAGDKDISKKKKFISIGTGSITGVYYPTGGGICRLVNAKTKEHGIRCSTESTGGSKYNINSIRSGELEFGIAQSDAQYNAYNGAADYKDLGAYKDLRAVLSIHGEPVTVVARADANIKSLADLKGKRVNIGNPGSGAYSTWTMLEKALGWKRDDLKLASQLKSSELAQALCDNKIDAYFFVVGHPSALTKETFATCKANLVEVSGPAVEKLIAENPYFSQAEIPAGIYGGNKTVKTFGVGATLVTSSKVPDDVVYTLVSSLFDNLDTFKQWHKAFSNLKNENMSKDYLSISLHPGAARYYKEKGWKIKE